MCSAEFVLIALNKQLFWDQTDASCLCLEKQHGHILFFLELLFNNVKVQM